MNFINMYQNQLKQQKSVTTNGAIAYQRARHALVDFNFQVSALRNLDEYGIVKEFLHAYVEDPQNAIIYLFYLRDILEGLGERRSFRMILKAINKIEPVLVQQMIPYIPEYGRWDDLLCLIHEKDNGDEVIAYMKKQLEEDLIHHFRGENVSLLAKWLPSINASNNQVKQEARYIRDAFGYTSKNYRSILALLRNHIDLVESKMCDQAWDKINYEHLTSFNQLKYANAFLKHDEQRRKEYLSLLQLGKVKINNKALNMVDIVNQYMYVDIWAYKVKDYNETLEALWNHMDLPEMGDTLVIRDGSGSMVGNPIIVSTALAIGLSSHNQGYYKDKFITFSSSPEIVDLTHFHTLHDKIQYCMTFDDYSNTDLYKTLKLVLKTAIDNQLDQSQIPSRMVVISDMQFDGRYMHLKDTLLEEIQEEFIAYGYKLPRIIFWNVAENIHHTIPIQENELGLALVSSYSNDVLEMVLSNQLDPYLILLERLHRPRYQPIIDIVDKWKRQENE